MALFGFPNMFLQMDKKILKLTISLKVGKKSKVVRFSEVFLAWFIDS